ncbi:MAG: class II aldolase/adducin family protein [Rhodocyclaceae bacterium]|nr:class II aldolase/adducin family protein [Rhodocyclaceae bacterium]
MTFLHLNTVPHLSRRREVIDTALRMNAAGINHGKSGNVSARVADSNDSSDGFLITPTGIDYENLQPEQIVLVNMNGDYTGDVLPSSEWQFHRDIYAARPEIHSIVHTHSIFATSLASHHRDIPPFHYMIAIAGGRDIRCAPYATFGTAELSAAAVTALEGRTACLLAQHGAIACGATLKKALALAVEVEVLAKMYWHALQLGEPPHLSDDEMGRVIEKFNTYGQQSAGL